ETALHGRSVNTPTGLHRDILLAVDLKGGRHTDHARIELGLPDDIARLGVEGTEHVVIRSATEHQTASRGHERAPVRRIGELMLPHLLAGRQIPSLDFADMVRAFGQIEIGTVTLRAAREAGAGTVFDHGAALHLGAEVLVRRDEDVVRLRVISDGRPILTTPERGAEIAEDARTRLRSLGIFHAAGLRIHALDPVFLHVGCAADELDLAFVGPLKLPKHAVTGGMHQALDLLATILARQIDEDRSGHFVPVERVVRMVLEVSLDRAALGVERNHRSDIEVVARALIAHPRAAISDTPVDQLAFGIV